MWCSSSWRIRRREALLALAAAAAAGPAPAQAPSPPAVPAGLDRLGSGTFRRFGFTVYDATLWARRGAPTQPPLALQLTYRRGLSGATLAEASIDQMRRQGVPEPQLQAWGPVLAALLPDVQPGDRLLGLHLPEAAPFFHNDRPIGQLNDTALARRFFAIWLDERTSAPDLRAALLQGAAP